MTHLTLAALCLAAFAALALAMQRHQHTLFDAGLPRTRTRALRIAGWGLLAAALAFAVRTQGWSLGLVAYAGHISLAAALVLGGLIVAGRRRVR